MGVLGERSRKKEKTHACRVRCDALVATWAARRPPPLLLLLRPPELLRLLVPRELSLGPLLRLARRRQLRSGN